MAMAGANPFAIMMAMGHADMKTTMIYVSLGKSHIRDRVEKLNAIPLLAPPTSKMKALPPPPLIVSGRYSQSNIFGWKRRTEPMAPSSRMTLSILS